MTALYLLQLSASIFGFAMFFVICNFIAMGSAITSGEGPKWWMFVIHIVFGLVASVSGLVAAVAGVIWLMKNLQ
jgi:hypothetical protein